MQNRIQNLTLKSIELFRGNFELILSIGIISTTINLSYQILFSIPANLNSAGYIILFNLMLLALFIPFIYYTTRLLIATIIIISERIHEKETSIKTAFLASKQKFWGFFGNAVAFILLLFIPVLLFSLPNLIETNITTEILLKTISFICGAYIILNYGMSIIISVLKSEARSYFRLSSELFKENKSLTIQAYILVAILFGINTYIPELILEDHLILGVINSNLIMSELIGLIISPLILVIMVFVFWLSKNDKEATDH